MTTETEVLAKATADEQLAVANDWSSRLATFVITNDQEQEQVAGVLRDVKARFKALEESRTSITKPLNDALRAVNELFRPPKTKFENLERMLKDMITVYLRRKQQENERALKAAAVAPTPQVAQQALATVAPVEPPKGVSIRYVWKFEVTDPDLVPRELCSPDPNKISQRAAVTQDIPGVRFFQESVVTSRRT